MSLVSCPSCATGNSEFDLVCVACGARLPEALSGGDTWTFQPEARDAVGPAVGPPSTLVGAHGTEYLVLDTIGRGAMGTVFRARSAVTGEMLAIKTVPVAQAALLPRIRREIHALSRIAHPGIVRILDSGDVDGVPWYTMELVEGTTLRKLVRAELAAALKSRLTLVRRLCTPLAYLHGEGLVHRDLKPENVLVRPDGQPVLVDFGLASEFAGALSRESLAAEIGVAGTLQYMSPEQLRGELLDARADLYALGCILHELLTGLPPFTANTPGALIKEHLQRTPPPPSTIVAGIPETLDALVMRLLAKHPAERIGHADDVASVLEAHGAEPFPENGLPSPRAYLYRPGLAGRTDTLRELAGSLSRVQEGAGGLVLLGGESGVGKTRLAMELVREAGSRGLRVLVGECLPPASGPLEPLRRPLQAIADRCREQGQAETERLLGRRGTVLAAYEPSLAGLPGQEEQSSPPELPASEARQRLFGNLTETLSAFVEMEPSLLLLDDLHWADDLTMGWLESGRQFGHFERMGLLVVGTYRTEDAGQGSRAPLQSLLHDAQVRRISLGRLDESAVGAMIGDMLALAPPPELFTRFLLRHSEGNPFFVAEYLRTAVSEGVLRRDAAGQWQVVETIESDSAEEVYAALPLPSSIRDLVGRRLERLSPAGKHILESAAILGREVDEVLLAKMAHVGGALAMGGIEELLAAQILEELELGRLRFLHDKLREVAEARIEGPERTRLHHDAALAIATLPEVERDRYLSVLGYHWERGGERDKARAAYKAGAKKAMSRYAFGEGERLYRDYLALVDVPTRDDIAVRNDLGTTLYHQWRLNESTEEHKRAAQEARSIGDFASEAKSLCQLAITAIRNVQLEEACDTAERALVVAREIGLPDLEGRCLTVIANVRTRQGRPEQARPLYEELLRLSRSIGNRRLEGITLGNLALLLRETEGATEEVIGLIEQAQLIAREIGDRLSVGRTLMDLAMLHHAEGRLERALDLYTQALAETSNVGDRWREGMCHAHRARLARQLGNAGEAVEHLDAAELLLRGTSDLDHRSIIQCERGHLALMDGRSAASFLQAARAMSGEVETSFASGVHAALERLEEAQRAFEAGVPRPP